MKPYFHARISAHKLGGDFRDYLPLHDFFDLTKGALADMRHRAILHSDWGCELALQRFGTTVSTSQGDIETATIARHHQLDDLGRVVPLAEWLAASEKPAFMKVRCLNAAYRPFRLDPLAAARETWGGEEEAYRPLADYFLRPLTLTGNHPLALAVSLNAFSIMLSDQLFGPVTEIAPGRLLPTRDFGERQALAHFGRIPTLGEALSGLKIDGWMLGSEVARARREARTLCSDLPLTD